ncbi:alkaline phosphatase family protein [Rugosimonospora acidiphila]|uniref:Alkaline phosphatase family protein n=1 Tax=Rugosimonospora acidiphila TaxID=556531 RepID=A0ABP9SSE7_9ACTN
MQVARKRRGRGRSLNLSLPGLANRRVRLVVVGAATLALVGLGSGAAFASTRGLGNDQAGQNTRQGLVLSDDQIIKPIGDRLVINGGKIEADTISPDGTHLAALTTDGGIALTIVDLKNWKVQQLIGSGATANLKISGGDVGQQGPTYSPDGKSLWVPRTDGYSRFPVNADGSVSAPTTVTIPADGAKHALPAQAVFSTNGATVYAAVNGQNRIQAIDAATGTLGQSWAVGNAPRGILRVGNKLYVSNEGGRTATAGDTTINSYGTQVPADPNTGATTTGTVSVIDLAHPTAVVKSINVGLHPTDLYAKNGTLFVTNTASDTVSLIDTGKDKVVQTITTRPWDEASVGYEPDGITLTNDGHLLVTLGRANAVAVYKYSNAKNPVKYVGLLPTDYFPASVDQVGGQIVVGNTRGIDAARPDSNGHNTHDTTSSLTRFKLPSDHDTAKDTDKVFQYNGWTNNSVQLAKGKKAKAVAVPAKIGDPSTIKHVFLLVKENRTYDQVFGDMPQGNGDPSLTQFGENVTPNQHALAEQFGLYDNFYDPPTNSAEGHNWLMQADNPEYTESSAGEYLRSYDTEDDALGHQRSGFIWSGAQAVGDTVRDYGEFNQFESYPSGNNWGTFYCDAQSMEATGAPTTIDQVTSSPIPSLNDVTDHAYPKFDTSIPDMYRYEIWKQDFEKNGPANLNMFWLSSDHTGGPLNSAAQVADNDLAVGKIVDTISHSKYWKDSAIFVVEDDSQAGQDHVDGHRAPIQVISPYAQRGAVDDSYYSQVTMVRTIEQILGIHPMNQEDSAATPMTTAFTNKPNFTPFTAVPNKTSLTLGYATEPSCGWDNVPAADAAAQPSTVVPAAAKQVETQWQQWKSQQRLTGPNAVPDYANPAQMNHYTWYDTHGWTTPYPGESKIYAPNQVPGAFIPSSDSDG